MMTDDDTTHPPLPDSLIAVMKVLTIVIVSVVLLAVITLTVSSLYRAAATDTRNQRPESRYSPEVQAMRAEWAAQIEGEPRWEIRAEDDRTLVIPVEMAMKAVIAENNPTEDGS